MTPERWNVINRIFHAALEAEPEQRDALVLTQSGGDAEVAAEVEELLRADEQAGSTYLDRPIDPSAFLSMQSPSVAVGDVLCQRFRIERALAEGGMGQVFEAFDIELAVRIALKVIRPEIAANPEAVARFRQEVRLARTITHPGICRTFDLERDTLCGGEVIFLTMEFLPGETLACRLQRDGAMPLAEALVLARQVASALEAAHALDIVHRDMKPANIMLVPPENGTGPVRAVITDFGLARLDPLSLDRLAQQDGHTALSHTGRPIGTLSYMAPEQLEGTPISVATDVYAFALILFEMATGERLFKSVNLLTGIAQRLKDAAPSIAQHAPQLPELWRNAIEAGLRREPDERPRSAAELLQIVEGKRLAPALGKMRRSITHGRVLVLAALILFAAMSLFYSGLRFSGWKADSKVAPGALVYLAEVKNLTGEKSLDATTELLRASLAQSAHVNLLDQGRVGDLLQQMKKNPETQIDGPVGREIAMRAGAARVVFATITGSKGAYSLDIDIQQLDNTPVRYRDHWTQRFAWNSAASSSAPSDIPSTLLSAVRSASGWIRNEVGESANDIARLDTPPEDVTTSNWQALADYAYAEKLFSRTHREQAITALQSAVQKDPGFALAQGFLGDVLVNDGRHSEGFAAYRRALDAGLNGRLSLRERNRIKGMIGQDTEDYQAAEAAFREYTLYYEYDYYGWFRRARPLFLMGRIGEAITALKRANSLDSSRPIALVQLTGANLVLEDQAAVDYWLHELQTKYPRDFYLYALGPIQVTRGGYDAAAVTLQELARPTAVPAFQWTGSAMLANLRAEQGRYEEAANILTERLEQDPGKASVLIARAHLYGKLRRYDACIADLELATRNDTSAFQALAASRVLGLALTSSPPKDARVALRKLLVKLEQARKGAEEGLLNELAVAHLRGEILLADGKTGAAVAKFREASAIDSSNGSREYLARALRADAAMKTDVQEKQKLILEAAKLYATSALHPAVVWEFSQQYPPGFYADQMEALLRLPGLSPNPDSVGSSRAELLRTLSRLRPQSAILLNQGLAVRAQSPPFAGLH